ncbi:sigma-70 family RNA polymerase sigma factor [Microbacterium arborescens]|uniref:sigma-70 family RNA polymerase sigma factor n=1 Tax=Microbacterium arborescens TaxID=33883 RepID=UPI0025A0F340|nr:sigma-70 family RNA polymerase sigma factor [Microbacterium arborescens]WJM15281.1 sigma-70 family RNA polymerase sigma factor [Microbacterium arborescens]
MASSDDNEPRTPTAAASDDELVERARNHDERAYGELWLRHSAAAHAVARAYSSLDPDDVVAEAFARILSAIRRGGGPSMGFRPYLLTSVRNVAHKWGAQQQQVYATDLEDAADETAPDAEWSTIAGFDSSAVASAFATLPTRWQEALWYSEVDGLKPRQFAPLLGLAPNAASALVVRARRGFRDAWVSAQLRRADNEECRETLELLGAHSRSGLSRRDTRRVEQHLSTCEGCALAWVEARDVSSRLALVLVPLVVGIPAAASYTAWTQSGAAQVATFALGPAGATGATGGTGAGITTSTPRGTTTGAPTSRRAARSATRSGWRRPLFVVVAAVAAAGTAIAVTLPLTEPTTAPPRATGSEPHPHRTSSDARAAGAVSESPTSEAPPVAEPPAQPPHDATPDAHERSAPSPRLIPAPNAPSVPSSPRPQADATASPNSPVDTGTSEHTPTPTPTPNPTPTPGTSQPPVVTAPAAPTMTVDSSAGPSVYPLISGTATPGAVVEVIDENGTVWARTEADADGAWTASDLSGGRDQTDAAAYLPPGRHALSARQRVDGQLSSLCPPAAVTVSPPPTFTAPLASSSVPASGFDIGVTGQPNLVVQRARVDDAAPWRDDLMRLDADGTFVSRYMVPAPGPVTLAVRYIDPATGRFGPPSFVSFTTF